MTTAWRLSVDLSIRSCLGEKTYEFGLQHGARFSTQPKHYVFSRNPTGLVRATGVEFVSEEPAAFAKHLRAQPGKDIWMMGGAELIGSFLDQDQIDEFIIHVIPTLIGEGYSPPRARSARSSAEPPLLRKFFRRRRAASLPG